MASAVGIDRAVRDAFLARQRRRLRRRRRWRRRRCGRGGAAATACQREQRYNVQNSKPRARLWSDYNTYSKPFDFTRAVSALVLPRQKLVAPGVTSSRPSRVEPEAGRRDDARAAELHGADLLAVAVVDVGVRAARTRPRACRIRSTAAVRTVGATSGSSPGRAPRPAIGNRRDHGIDLAALDHPLEHQLALASYLRNIGWPAMNTK